MGMWPIFGQILVSAMAAIDPDEVGSDVERSLAEHESPEKPSTQNEDGMLKCVIKQHRKSHRKAHRMKRETDVETNNTMQTE